MKLFLIDAGHGGIHPTTKEYVTAGKRSPDGKFYEGVNNRINAKLIVTDLNSQGINSELLFDTWRDVSLSQRVKKVNELAKEKDVVLISIHSDAASNDWSSAKGISVYTSKGHTRSDDYATIMYNELEERFKDITNMRPDRFSDGDPDKESQFYILTKTTCPAMLLELGFHTNKEEVELMQTDAGRGRIIEAMREACKQINS